MPTQEEDGKTLTEFGLTQTQASVYLAIARLGLASFGRFRRTRKSVEKRSTESYHPSKN